MSNVFPERMDGSLQLQTIPPVLSAYNKYMGGVALVRLGKAIVLMESLGVTM